MKVPNKGGKGNVRSVLRTRPVRMWMTCAFALYGLVDAANVSAQSNVTTSITGTVRDASGAAVSGAALTIRNLANDTAQRATTDSAGKYGAYNLTPGTYEITAAKYGFSDSLARVVVAVHRQVHSDLKLKPAGVADAAVEPPADSKKMDAMEARIEQLEVELKTAIDQRTNASSASAAQSASAGQTALPAVGSHGPLLASIERDPSQLPISPGTLSPDLTKVVATTVAPDGSPQQSALPASPSQNAPPAAPAAPAVDLQTPFAYGDFTWLNGNPRNKDTVVDTPFFTPEVRFDTHYMEDFNQPTDHTIVGATESFRSGEVQVEQISVGGDFHWQNVRGTVLTMFGLFATTTPRNDASFAVGQWNLRDAYKYTSEAYGGYH